MFFMIFLFLLVHDGVGTMAARLSLCTSKMIKILIFFFIFFIFFLNFYDICFLAGL